MKYIIKKLRKTSPHMKYHIKFQGAEELLSSRSWRAPPPHKNHNIKFTMRVPPHMKYIIKFHKRVPPHMKYIETHKKLDYGAEELKSSRSAREKYI